MPQLMSRALELIKAAKTGEPVLNLDRSVAAETLWPATLEEEADKAASILRSFFLDGFIVPYRTLGKCPQRAISNCRAIAAFHVLRAGLRSPSASGSGVIISRLPAGQWSNASAVVVELDLPEDVDVADIVVVLNDQDDLNAISRQAQSPGKALKTEPGPIPESDTYASHMCKALGEHTSNFFYAKSKGHLLQLDLRNLEIREASGENENFYGVPGVSVGQILSGQVKSPSGASAQLNSTLAALEKQNPSLSGLPKSGNCPGDRRVRAPRATSS